jgi:hypothetical protein
MKLLVTILVVAASLIALVALSGCVTDEYGNTRFDAETFNGVTRTTLDAYDRVNARYPDRPVPVYPAPVYPVYPVAP